MPDKEAAAKVEAYATQKIQEGDSIGGIIECVVEGMMRESVNRYLTSWTLLLEKQCFQSVRLKALKSEVALKRQR